MYSCVAIIKHITAKKLFMFNIYVKPYAGIRVAFFQIDIKTHLVYSKLTKITK